MLFNYQQQRQADSAVYGQAMEQQHEFAKQQLAQQLYEAKLKAVPDYLGKPGGAQLIGAGGIPGLDMGADPATIAKVQAAGLAHEQSMNLAEAGKGIEGASAGGLQIAPEGVSALQGLNVTNLGTNARVQAELIRQQTELQKQKMKGAGGGRGGAEAGTFALNPSDASGQVALSYRPPRGQSIETSVANLRERGFIPPVVKPPGQGTGAGGRGDSGPGGSTSLQPASNKPGVTVRGQPPAGTRIPSAAPGADPVQRAAASHLERVVRTQNHDAYKNIVAGAKQNGGQIQLVTGPDGKHQYKGADGKLYK